MILDFVARHMITGRRVTIGVSEGSVVAPSVRVSGLPDEQTKQLIRNCLLSELR